MHLYNTNPFNQLPIITKATDVSLIAWSMLIALIFIGGTLFLIRGSGAGKYEPSIIETITGATLVFMAGIAAGFAFYPIVLG